MESVDPIVVKPIVLKSLHDVQEIDIKSIGDDLKFWSKFQKVDFRGHASKYKWHFSIVLIFISITVCVWKFGGLCKRGTNSNVTITFQAAEATNETHTRYPVFQ